MASVLLIADAAAIHTVRWANAIAGRGWAVHLVSMRPPREPLAEGVTFHRAPWAAPAGYFTNAWFVRRKARELRPDLVHAHYASGYGTLSALADRHPLLLSVWGSDVYEFPDTSPLHAWLLRRNLRRADRILSTSSVMARQTMRFTDREISVTPFGIDLARFRSMPVKSPFQPEDIVIGTVKTLAAKYGVEYLVRAFALLKGRLEGYPLKLLLVGAGPQEAELRALVRDLGLEQDTVFTGHVPHARVPEFQNMLSVSVSVSTLHSESFGVAVLEASACEKPVVVSAVGGLAETVEDGVTGILVPPRDAEGTAEAIARLVVDEPLRRRMGRAGRVRVQRLYEWGSCVDRMMEHYRSMLTPAASSQP